eukprot:CAMPEP_0197614954 /NCGR_PEP_ID=MMETSP1326-20131121/59788_1 /TAXON_ID=1155430 /ORGANISM="Genus nov. species nov., Strain RCC2288" /LENGTH=141 /DNA_ID=CAMNT_0043183835 /DNA_START=1490 /DNA_END=1915 /DNA_ORIENTATION=-
MVNVLPELQQVVALVVVDLHVADMHGVRGVRLLGHLAIDAADGARDDAAVHVLLGASGDGERLARARLSVREHGAVEALQRAQDHLGGDALEHLVLLRVRADDAVELELVVLALVVHVPLQVVARDVEVAQVLIQIYGAHA